MAIGDYVFIGPSVCTANARRVTHRRQVILAETVEQGPTIEFGPIIGSQAMLLPGIRIGREAMVAAGSLISKDVLPFAKMFGAPARQRGEVTDSDRLRAGVDFPLDYPILKEA